MCKAISALCFTYATGALWEKYQTVAVQPIVAFSYDALVVLETSTGPRVWSTSPALNSALTWQTVQGDLKYAEEDPNATTNPTALSLIFEGKGLDGVDVLGAKMIAQFSYAFNGTTNVQLYGLAVASAGGPSGSGVQFTGDLNLVARGAGLLLDGSTNEENYVKALKDPGNLTDTLYAEYQQSVTQMLRDYYARPIRTEYNAVADWQSGASSSFVVDVRIQIPNPETIVVRRGRLQLLFIGFVRAFVTFYVFWFVVSLVSNALFHFRVFNTRVRLDVAPKAHQY